MSPDGKSRIIYANGLRDTIGFDWNPKTGQLWGMDRRRACTRLCPPK